MMTSSNGNIFRLTGNLCGEFTGPRWIPGTKASDAEICVWINGWVNNREAGDLRRYRAHYDVIVMIARMKSWPLPVMLITLVDSLRPGCVLLCLSISSSGFHEEHYNDVIMDTIASQTTSLTIVYSTVYSDADQRKHQSSASLAFVWGIHRDRWIPRTNGQWTRKMFPFDDIIMSKFMDSVHIVANLQWTLY